MSENLMLFGAGLVIGSGISSLFYIKKMNSLDWFIFGLGMLFVLMGAFIL